MYMFFYFVHIFIFLCVIMTSAFLAISTLKQSSLPEKQLSNFLFYLSQEALREYLLNADIYKRKKRMSKSDLVDMAITGVPRNIRYFDKEDELTMDKALEILSNNDDYNT